MRTENHAGASAACAPDEDAYEQARAAGAGPARAGLVAGLLGVTTGVTALVRTRLH